MKSRWRKERKEGKERKQTPFYKERGIRKCEKRERKKEIEQARTKRRGFSLFCRMYLRERGMNCRVMCREQDVLIIPFTIKAWRRGRWSQIRSHGNI